MTKEKLTKLNMAKIIVAEKYYLKIESVTEDNKFIWVHVMKYSRMKKEVIESLYKSVINAIEAKRKINRG